MGGWIHLEQRLLSYGLAPAYALAMPARHALNLVDVMLREQLEPDAYADLMAPPPDPEIEAARRRAMVLQLGGELGG